MRRITFAAFLVLIGATLTYGIQPEIDWRKFSSSEGRFSVLLPREPKLEVITDPENKELIEHRYSDVEAGYGFICEYFDFASVGTDLEAFLDATRDGIIRGAGATKLGEEKISLDGYPGRELKMSIVNNGLATSVQTRIFIVGKRLYSVTYVYLKETEAKVAAETAAKFFSSFTLSSAK